MIHPRKATIVRIGSEDDWGDVTVSNCIFWKCFSGVSAKRQMRRFRVVNNNFLHCSIGASQSV